MKQLFIMRGVPGSGKSTLATTLVKTQPYNRISADDYLTRPDGTYVWDPVQLGAAHKDCRNRLTDAMIRGLAPLVVDNTNIKNSDAASYEALGRSYGYEVVEVTMKPPSSIFGDLDVYVDACVARGTHAVPRETVKRMAERLRGG